ncbi:hypothetical protein [Microbacterium sp. YY-01]
MTLEHVGDGWYALPETAAQIHRPTCDYCGAVYESYEASRHCCQDDE